MKICMFYSCHGSNVSFQKMEILSRNCTLILVFILIQGPEPVSVLAPVGSFVEFNCKVNPSELPANTISRDNITTSDSTSEYDQYVWIVTAINPAGTSTPANHNFILESGKYVLNLLNKSFCHFLAPISLQSDICISNESSCATVNYLQWSRQSSANHVQDL